MKHATNNWYVLTGGPSTGKTTLLAALQARGYATVHEAARQVIDEGLAKGVSVAQIRRDEAAFQQAIFARKVQLESQLSAPRLIFLDRGMHDSLAYFRYYSYKPTTQMNKAFQTSRYRKVFLLEPLPVFDRDYARTETGDFAQRIQTLLFEAYAEYGMEPVAVPPVSVDARVQFILQNAGQPLP